MLTHYPSSLAIVICFTACFSTLGLAQQPIEPNPGKSVESNLLPAESRRLKVKGIENFIQVSDRVFSGGEPTREGLDYLQKLGIEILLSVDGLEPNREAAEKRGMKYVHIPIGYDGIDPSQLQDFVTLMAHHQGKMFVHCHHGKHRGPAAVAACLIISKTMTKEEATQFMREAGTSKDYKGLWKSIAELDIKEFHPQDFSSLLIRSNAKSLAQWMAELERAWENLETQSDHPKTSLSPHQLSLVREAFRESARVVSSAPENQFGNGDRTTRLIEWLKTCEQTTAEIETSTHSQAHEKARDLLKTLAKQCVDCHTEYRN